MKKSLLFVSFCFLATQAQAASQPTPAQRQAISAKAKAFTGKTCASFSSFLEVSPAMDAATFKESINMMVEFQKKHGFKSLKQKLTATEFQQHVQDKKGTQEQFIYNSISQGKTTNASCILKK